MDSNAKNTRDDAGNYALFIGGAAFSTIYEKNEAIWYIMGVEVAWGEFLIDFIGYISVKTWEIPDGMVRSAVEVRGEVLDTLELWCRAGILHNM